MPVSVIAALRASVPVLFGYIPLGLVFGMLFQQLGYPWYYAAVMGLVIYAGAAQFMAVGMLAAHASLLEVAVAVFVLNSRHLFFGVSLLNRYRATGWKKCYLIFGLTDETYSLITASDARHHNENFYLMLTAINQFYWVAGCAAGALIGESWAFETAGMEFVLTALFAVLLVEQIKKVRRAFPYLIALFSGVVAMLLFSGHMLLTAMTLAVLMLMFHYRTVRNSV